MAKTLSARPKKPISKTELWFCVALVLGLYAIFWGFVALEQLPTRLRLQREGVVTSASITSKYAKPYSCGRSSKPDKTCYEYRLWLRVPVGDPKDSSIRPLDSYHVAMLNVGQAQFDALQEGGSLAVVYLPERPNQVWQVHEAQAQAVWQDAFWIVLLAFGATGAGVMTWRSWKHEKYK
jgi:predicted GNAT superfamily acetyltransferase